MGKYTEINKQMVVKFWFNWTKHGAVSYWLSCILSTYKVNNFLKSRREIQIVHFIYWGLLKKGPVGVGTKINEADGQVHWEKHYSFAQLGKKTKTSTYWQKLASLCKKNYLTTSLLLGYLWKPPKGAKSHTKLWREYRKNVVYVSDLGNLHFCSDWW